MIDLGGRTVLVTGAGHGIGAVIAQAMLAAGATVVAQHRSRTAGLDAASGRLRRLRADLTDPQAPERVVQAAVDAGGGRLDAVVNAAAEQRVDAWSSLDADAFDAVLAVNLRAAHLLTRAAGAAMTAGGVIVHIASIEGTAPAPGHAHYAVSKAGLIMLARAAALELGRDGIRVCTVSPGLVDREGLAEDWPDGVARWRVASPLGRLVRPQEVADACVFLCSPMAAAITGVDLVVDAGVSAGPRF